MGLFDFFKKKNKNEFLEDVEAVEIKEESFIDTAKKTADIISATIDEGKYDAVPKELEKIFESYIEKERFVFEAPGIFRWVFLLLMGLIFSVAYVYILLIAIGTIVFSSSYRLLGAIGVLGTAFILFFNVLMIRKAVMEISFLRRYSHYHNILRYRSIEIVDDLADMIEVDRKLVEGDLAKAVKNKIIPQGHFGKNNVIFMVSDDIFEKYTEKRAVYDRYFKNLIAERERMNVRTKETEELLEQDQEYVEKIRDTNDLIKDKEISNKLDRMEKVVAAIFHEVDINPAQSNKLGVFMGDYLPTTEKLLEAYLELDEKEVKGKSVKKTKVDISNALDSINIAFESLLERFYEEQERDISSDIFAMEAIMKQEGLQNGENE